MIRFFKYTTQTSVVVLNTNKIKFLVLSDEISQTEDGQRFPRPCLRIQVEGAPEYKVFDKDATRIMAEFTNFMDKEL